MVCDCGNVARELNRNWTKNDDTNIEAVKEPFGAHSKFVAQFVRSPTLVTGQDEFIRWHANASAL